MAGTYVAGTMHARTMNRQTRVKPLPSRSFVAGGKHDRQIDNFFFFRIMLHQVMVLSKLYLFFQVLLYLFG